MQNKTSFPIIGVIHSCFTEKFGVPRQPGLVPAALSRVELLPPYNDRNALMGLEAVSHIWLMFGFHLNRDDAWRPKIRPPRLGGNRSLGVFATRSPYRPSTIGLSAVKLECIEGTDLWVSGLDAVDGSPVFDIKPYVPYADSIDTARNDIATAAPERFEVVFSEAALAVCREYSKVDLKALIAQVLSLDPRPQYQNQNNERIYGISLLDQNIRWRFQDDKQILVLEITNT